MNSMKLTDIRIPETFAKPKDYKFLACEQKFLQSGKQDRYLVLNSKNELKDGYIMYLVLKKHGCESAEVVFSDVKRAEYFRIGGESKETTYVLGVHPKRPAKAYYWRIPDTWENMKNTLRPGDEIICRNSTGRGMVRVVNVVTLPYPPVNRVIRRVAPCRIRRNGKLIDVRKEA